MKSAHYMGKVQAVRRYRAGCFALARLAMPRGWMPCRVIVDIEYRCWPRSVGYAPRDVHNASAALKAGLDGALTDARVVLDDSADWVRLGSFSLITTKHPKGDGVTLTVRPA